MHSKNFLKQKSCLCFILAIALLAAACTPPAPPALETQPQPPTSLPSATAPIAAPPTDTPTPEPTQTPTPLLSVRALTYNVLYGAGVDPQYWVDRRERHKGNRLEKVVTILKQANADVIGVQEAIGWDDDEFAAAKQVAESLGMNYAVAAGDDLKPVIFTRYKIVETETLTPQIGGNGVLRARLMTPDGQPLNVFVIHLIASPKNEYTRICEIKHLESFLARYANERSLVLGDYNSGRYDKEAELFNNAGWQLAAYAVIDHIRVSPGVKWSSRDLFEFNADLVWNASDHPPIGTTIDFYESGASTLPLPTPTPKIPLPEFVNEYLTGAQISKTETFDQGVSCYEEIWSFPDKNSFQSEQLVLLGSEDWNGASRMMRYNPGEAALVRLKFSKDSTVGAFFDLGEWKTPDYRRFGFSLEAGKFHPNVVKGPNRPNNIDFSKTFTPAADTWYNLLIAAGTDGRFLGILWNPEKPTQQLQLIKELGEEWKGPDWRLAFEVFKGEMVVDEISDIVFESIK